ncbi:hypothetical protein N3K63_03305 [Microbacterium sp. W1N]|uniref:hypothetical protein n=1 Tax=Microbacterium festucae TaxID=2977531 RepID=UPI0021BE14ED|nr:hypothetical protein [Microbacterium festucae]MCT9819309.1 hypothetical protein [Microbacterium festucae]
MAVGDAVAVAAGGALVAGVDGVGVLPAGVGVQPASTTINAGAPAADSLVRIPMPTL